LGVLPRILSPHMVTLQKTNHKTFPVKLLDKNKNIYLFI
jgi:hypothetical protein